MVPTVSTKSNCTLQLTRMGLHSLAGIVKRALYRLLNHHHFLKSQIKSYVEFLDDLVMVILQLGHLASNASEFIFEGMNSIIGVHQVVVLLLQPEQQQQVVGGGKNKFRFKTFQKV